MSRRTIAATVAILASSLGSVVALPSAVAGERRYALVVGANRGDAADPALLYAVQDARRVAETLRDLGGFAPEDVVTLEDPSADALRSTLARVNARIRQDQEGQKVHQGLLVVYYSGHADALALHLGGTRLPWEELRNLTLGSSAEARLLVVDACRSGNATRVKGTRLGEPFALPAHAEPVPEGFAIISSAAAGESAQESEALEGSFFTHHLLSALLGGGDADGDGRVGLGEAYRYAADRTTASTATTLGGMQHPTYAFELRGRGDLVLTRPGAAAARGRVVLDAPGVYLLRKKGPEGPLAAEVSVADALENPVAVSLPPGRYFVSRRTPGRFEDGAVEIPASGAARLAEGDLRPVSPGAVGRKGRSGPVYSTAFGVGLSGPGLGGFGMGRESRLELARDTGAFGLDLVAGWTQRERPRVAFNGVSMQGPFLTSRLDDLQLLVGARWNFLDLETLGLSLGLRAGLSVLRQSFDVRDVGGIISTPTRVRLAPRAEATLRIEVPLPRSFFLWGEGALGGTYVAWSPVMLTPTSREYTRSPVTAGFALGAGVVF